MCTATMEKINPNTTPTLSPPSAPPFNDRCPICFDDFTLPCRSNCRHWFCASCILEFWRYGASLKPCKCPLCFTRITCLTPQFTLCSATTDSATATRVIKNVYKYNSLYAGGASGFIVKVCMIPSVIMRCLLDMSDRDYARQRYYYCVVRTIALFMSIIYMVCSFDFLPRGVIFIPRFFEMCGVIFMGFIHLFGMVRRYWLRRQIRN